MTESERTWLSTLYESNVAAVSTVCRRVLLNPEDAADATHEVFLRALSVLPKDCDPKAVRPWLVVVARNHCLDVLRRRKRFDRVLMTLALRVETNEEVETTVADREVADAVLKQLRLRERQVLWHADVERRPLSEVASFLGLSYMAAAQVLHRARRRALLLAAKLAAVFGLYRLGRAIRPATSAGVAVVAPLIVGALISSSAAQPPRGPGAIATPAKTAAGPTSSDRAGTAAASAGSKQPSAGLPLTALPSAIPAINDAISSIERQLSRVLGTPLPQASPTIPGSPVLTSPPSPPKLP